MGIHTHTEIHVSTWSTEAGGLHHLVKVLRETFHREQKKRGQTQCGTLEDQLWLCAQEQLQTLENCGTKPNRRQPWYSSKCFLWSSEATDNDLLTQPKTRAWNLADKDIFNKKKKKIYFAMIKKKKLIVKYKSLYIRLFYFCVAYLKKKTVLNLRISCAKTLL